MSGTLKDMFAKATHVYAAKDAGGRYFAVATDVPEFKRDTAKDVADWLRRGATVERLTFAEWRAVCDAGLFGSAKGAEKQGDLFASKSARPAAPKGGQG